jgi:molybdopterin synthase sulfur carrier subunit
VAGVRRPGGGCAPVSAAFAGRARRGAPGPAGHHRQVAGHRQPGGRAVRARRGAAHRRRIADVSDAEIVDSIRLLAATEGIFGETAGGVTLGVLRKLLAAGQLDPDAETVIINSGDGLKTLDAVTAAVEIPGPDQADPRSFPGGNAVTVQVRIPTILRSYTGGAAEVTAAEGTLRDVIAGLDADYPGLGGRILDDGGKLRRFVNVYVGDEDVRFAQGLDTQVAAGSRVSVIPAVAGGAPRMPRLTWARWHD